MDTAAATRALKDIEGARLQVADRMSCPPAWHFAFGAIMGAMIAGQAAPVPVAMVVLVVSLGAAVLMMQAGRRRLGFFVNGYRRGRTRKVALGLLAGVEVLLFSSLYLKLGRHIWWAPLVAGSLAAPLAVVGSYTWQRAYKRDLAEAVGA